MYFRNMKKYIINKTVMTLILKKLEWIKSGNRIILQPWDLQPGNNLKQMRHIERNVMPVMMI